MKHRFQRGQSEMGVGCGIAVVVAIVVLGFIGFTSHAQVNAGEVGVVSQWGAIDAKQQPMAPGFHWLTPFAGYNVDNVPVRQQAHTFKEVGTGSRELQNVYVDGKVNYHIDPSEAAGIQINGGLDAYVSRTFDPAFQTYIKEVVPQYTTIDILAHRAEITGKVLTKLREKAADAALSYHVKVDDLFITDIHYDKSYTDAIAAKAVAQQQLEQAKIDAQKAVQVAQGQADAQVTTARGEATSNQLRASGINQELVDYLAVQKWDGHLPQVSGGNTPFVSVTSPGK